MAPPPESEWERAGAHRTDGARLRDALWPGGWLGRLAVALPLLLVLWFSGIALAQALTIRSWLRESLAVLPYHLVLVLLGFACVGAFLMLGAKLQGASRRKRE